MRNISCKLHDDRLNQLRDSLHLIRCRTLAVCVAKFLVLTGERTLLIANFRRGVENTTKFPLMFKANYRSKRIDFSLKILRDLSMKICKDKERNLRISPALLLHKSRVSL